ncbi:threonine ammonia-lyase [Anaerosalibacter sp. Marseille-P3206]|uniref:threonine ammonia-lyase n=1 Tax=Anaerosalibacter sp. Marseille-P3206 TaxID=1871005 RepID=UPI000986E77F|nr:threonine/serine dehydratase [Anaerosalibacter sp. Marseille-P3206]
MPIKYEDVLNARNRIDKYIYHTPLDKSMYLSDEDTNIYLKLECQQGMKCAKLRGALSKLTSLSKEEIERGIVAISSGNHGAAVSYATHLLGIKNVTIYVPATTPKSKVEKIKYYGANVVGVGENYDEAHEIGLERIKDSGSVFIDPCSDPVVLAGQGTIALEIFEQQAQIDTILVPIGGGGILTGISVAAKHINPNVKIIGLQTAACPAMVQSLKDKVFYEMFPTGASICDALVGGVGEIPYNMAERCIDDIWVIEEEDIAEAVSFLAKKEKVISEPAGAIGVAAVRKNHSKLKGRNAAVVITGGNIDESLMVKLLNQY